jgi:septum formation protein
VSPREIVLGSTSAYRRQLLARLLSDFRVERPEVVEFALPGEGAAAMVARLAQSKARAVATRCPGAIVIGSDQAAVDGERILGKAGDAEGACEQLASLSGREVEFLTALNVIDDDRGLELAETVSTRVRFRVLGSFEIAAYVARERPWDCAGSFKCEGLGIALFERITGDDPTALIGLPLIALSRILRELGVDPLLL